MFAFSAVAVGQLREMQNGGKKARRGLDAWDRVSNRAALAQVPGADEIIAKYDAATVISHLYILSMPQ